MLGFSEATSPRRPARANPRGAAATTPPPRASRPRAWGGERRGLHRRERGSAQGGPGRPAPWTAPPGPGVRPPPTFRICHFSNSKQFRTPEADIQTCGRVDGVPGPAASNRPRACCGLATAGAQSVPFTPGAWILQSVAETLLTHFSVSPKWATEAQCHDFPGVRSGGFGIR